MIYWKNQEFCWRYSYPTPLHTIYFCHYLLLLGLIFVINYLDEKRVTKKPLFFYSIFSTLPYLFVFFVVIHIFQRSISKVPLIGNLFLSVPAAATNKVVIRLTAVVHMTVIEAHVPGKTAIVL